MARLEKTIQNYKEKLRNKGIDNIPEFVQSILDADITKGKYSRFLLDCFIADKFREEDLQGGLESTVGQTISLFHKHKAKLPEEMRSVYKYETPGDLWSAVKQFDGELSGKELKKEVQDKIRNQTEFLYEDENTGLKIISPLTEDAAKWWGKGTRWCTAAEKNNMFFNYADKFPLLILLMPGGEKLQLWKGKKNIQFMDEADNGVTIDYIERNWHILEKVILWMDNINYIPEKHRTYDLFLSSLETKKIDPKEIPEEIQDYNMAKIIVKNFGLKNIKKELIDYELSKASLEKDVDNFFYIPEKYKTKEIYKIIIQKDEKFIKYVPEEFIDYDFIKLLVDNNGFSDIPTKFDFLIDKELCNFAIIKNAHNLLYIPEKFLTQEMCEFAIENNPYALHSIPKRFLNDEMIIKNLEKVPEFINSISPEKVTKELCEKIINYQINSEDNLLQYIPEKYKTEELCKLAIEHNEFNIHSVPDKYLTKDFYLFYSKTYSCNLNVIPEELRTYEIYLNVIKQNGTVLPLVPDKFKTKELCLEALKDTISIYQLIPKSLIDEDIIITLLKKDPYRYLNIPSHKFKKNYVECFLDHPTLYKNIPQEYKDDEFYKKILQLNPKNFIYLPKEKIKESDYIDYFFKYSNYEDFFQKFKENLKINENVKQMKM